MNRHYYISENIDDLEAVEHELESDGISLPQIHVLSENDMEVERHHLHEVESVLKQDVVHSAEIGALVGIVVAGTIIIAAYFSGMPDTMTWIPFIFLAVIVFGFCTWEGGLFGIQVPHMDFRRFQEVLHKGKYILFVDISEKEEDLLSRIIERHPQLVLAGVGKATPSMVIAAQKKFKVVMESLP